MDLFDSLKKSSHIGQKDGKNVQPVKKQHSNSDKDNRLSISTKTLQKQVDSKISPFKKELKPSHLLHKKSNDFQSKNQDQKLAKFNDKHKSHNSNNRRESMPSPLLHSTIITKNKNKKSRSLSPPKFAATNAIIKSLKVKVERKNLDDFLKTSINLQAKNLKLKIGKQKDFKDHPKLKSPIKGTPTKAQQKLFEPIGSKKSKAQMLKDFNIKKCVVRIHRDNLKNLMRDFKSRTSTSTNDNSSKPRGRPRKREAEYDELDDAPLAKRAKVNLVSKTKSNFFIKFNSPKLDKKSKSFTRMISTSSSVAHHNKIRNSKSLGNTTPTKFSRSQLIRSFGERFFTSFVRIEKCTHPLLLTFESNDRARSLKAKRNKSKNLTVSFREQVEVFGDTSDSDNSVDENFCVLPQSLNQKAGGGGFPGAGGRRSSNNSQTTIPATPVVMPARLKKVENGKVIDDIELDPSLFLDPKNLVASTPFSPGRKKRDHKSFSPLKDESSPSPRKEQLKLANEKIPPSGLRRLNIDEDDDEDDDCEYIVPIELPQRRTSQASSTNTLDSGPTLNLPPPVPEDLQIIVPDKAQSTEELKEMEKEANSHYKETDSLPMESSVPSTTIEAKSPTPPPRPISSKEASPRPLSPKESSPRPLSPKEDSPRTLSREESSPRPLSPKEASTRPLSPIEALPRTLSPKGSSTNPLSPKEASPIPSSVNEPSSSPQPPKEATPPPSPGAGRSASPLANLDTSPISSTSMPDLSDTESNPVTNIDTNPIPPLEEEATEEKESTPAKITNPFNDDNASNDSFQSAKDHTEPEKQSNGKKDSKEYQSHNLKSHSPSFALKDVFNRVVASACEAQEQQQQQQQQETQDPNEINGTGVSLNDMSMNLFMEDDSQAEDDSPEKSFVDSIINETIDKLGKDIGDGDSMDEQYTQGT